MHLHLRRSRARASSMATVFSSRGRARARRVRATPASAAYPAAGESAGRYHLGRGHPARDELSRYCGGDAVSVEVMFKFTNFTSAILLAISASLLAGCGDAEVAKADIEQTAMKQLSASVGKESPQITCPSGLKATVGTKLVCSMPIDGKVHDVTITVTAVDGTNVKYGIEVGDKPRG